MKEGDRKMELDDTIELMTSKNYKHRFQAEYFQLKNRLEKLENMVEKWDDGELHFMPTCPRHMYDCQINAMRSYLKVLGDRAIIEKINLSEE